MRFLPSRGVVCPDLLRLRCKLRLHADRSFLSSKLKPPPSIGFLRPIFKCSFSRLVVSCDLFEHPVWVVLWGCYHDSPAGGEKRCLYRMFASVSYHPRRMPPFPISCGNPLRTGRAYGSVSVTERCCFANKSLVK